MGQGAKDTISKMSTDLPHFERPPVVETVLGVQFEPLPKFRIAQLGAFWKRLGAAWPTVSDAPPLEPQFEQFGEAEAWSFPVLQFRIMKELNARIQIRNANGDRMIQLQNGRFHYNWFGAIGREYARYRTIKPEFDRIFAELQQFLADESLGKVRTNQWEVTYVNQIPKGTVWSQPSDWGTVFCRAALLRADPGETKLESLSGEWHFEIPPRRGRLHVHLQHGKAATADGPEVVTMTLTARGPATGKEDSALAGLHEGLDLGHETIVRAFSDLTSSAAQKYWGRKS